MKLSKSLILTQTDTTIGFLSQDPHRLDEAKKRPSDKAYIRVYPSLSALGRRLRIPVSHRKRVRRSNKTTFIHPMGASFRLVRDSRHLLLLRRLGWAYSSSANLSGLPYDEEYARSVADLIVEPLSHPAKASTILKLGKTRIQKIR